MEQAIVSIASLILAIPAAVVAYAAFRRSARAADVKSSADASAVGLEYLRQSLQTQQELIVRQEGEIGELRGQLKSCKEERETMASQIAELQERLP